MSFRLEIDPITCDGRGLCAELFPERVRLDDWGYPIIDPAPFDRRLRGRAKSAVSACPVLALRLAPVEAEARPPGPGPTGR